jgi:hypothetical protein
MSTEGYESEAVAFNAIRFAVHERTAAEHEAAVRLYAERVASGRDIWSGVPREIVLPEVAR